MRKGMRYLLPALPAALVLGAGLAVWAQESPAQAPAATPAAAVSPEVEQKAKTYKGSAVPPTSLQRMADGHWTPYTPPEKPAEGGEVYVIQRGDTLSGLAQQKLGNWLLWPQIWDQNPYIKDAHWIYPGDPLVIAKPAVVSEEGPIAPQPMQETTEGEAKPAGGEGERIQIDEEAPVPPVNAADVYCSGYITKEWRRPHLTVLSSVSAEKESLAQGDVVYVNEGTSEGIDAGMTFFILKEGQLVHHPKTGKLLGRYIQRIGQAKILAVQSHTSIAQITQSCDEIRYGAVMVPYRAIPVPGYIKPSESIPLQLPQSDRPLGRVVWTQDRLEGTGQSNIVYVNLGSRNQVIPGDKLWIYQYPAEQGTLVDSTRDLFRQQKVNVEGRDLFRSPKVGKYKPEKEEQALQAQAAAATSEAWPGEKAPSWENDGVSGIRSYIGEGVVLTTEGDTACVKILLSAKEISMGDWVQVE